MTIVDDNQVFATANIYEKDLNQIAVGQKVKVKVDSLRDSASAPGNGLRTFSGRITRIGSVVEGETRIIPVQAQLNNANRQLKPGMFAQLEVLTQTPTAKLAILSKAVVEAKGKQLVYIQNGDAYQSTEVKLGQISGNMVEVKSGLFEGDRIVTQGGNLLYSQSLRSDNKTPAAHAETTVKQDDTIPWWLVIPASGAIASTAFWVGRRASPQLMPVIKVSAEESPVWNDNHRVTEAHESTKNPK